MHKLKCKICDKEFSSRYKTTKFCSRECMGLSYRQYDRERICELCKKSFVQSASRRGKVQKFCSPKCAQNGRIKKRPTLKCQHCGKSFSSDRESRELTQKFCSKKCYNLHSKFRPKHKEKSCLNCGKVFYKPRKSKFCNYKCYHEFLTKFWDDGTFWKPGYNKKACEYFKRFDEENNTKGQYATNGGEHYIKELSYWVDYINFEKKLIIEWDEEKHYENDKLKQKDVLRQKAIQKVFPDFQFSRIREKDYLIRESQKTKQ